MRRVLVGLFVIMLTGCGQDIPKGMPTLTPTQQASAMATSPAMRVALGQTVKTWSDVDGRIRLKYPDSWQIGKLSAPENIALFSAPDKVAFAITAFPTQGAIRTADEAVNISLSANSGSTKYKYLNTDVSSTTVGGMPARLIAAQSLPRDNSTTIPSRDLEWVVVRNNVFWSFYATGEGMWDRGDVDAVIASVEFL